MTSPVAPQALTTAEAEAIATAVALHHLRAAAGAGTAAPATDGWSNWARAGVLSSLDRSPHPSDRWGLGAAR